MVNAVVQDGQIRPVEPLPADWRDGQRVRIEKADDSEPTAEEIARDFTALAASGETRDPADEEAMRRALAGQNVGVWPDVTFLRYLEGQADESVTVEQVRAAMDKVSGSMAEDLRRERDERL